MQPVIPYVTGNFLFKPVIFPIPPRKTGSLNVIRENKPYTNEMKRKKKKWHDNSFYSYLLPV